MRIVVASGKGGTGKTTIATSLALAAGESVRLVDCDVEAPNAALLLHPSFENHKEVGILVPVVDEEICTYCGICSEVCEFNAIAVIGDTTLTFPELCHGCGSCTMVCPEKAISERLNVMGLLQSGVTDTGVDFAQGIMHVGELMAVPVIRELKKWTFPTPCAVEIRDAPPGASCPVVEVIRGGDFVLLVTEPTPFGLHDLKQVVGITRELGIPAGVIINRDGIGDSAVDNYCVEASLPILMRIPMERRFAEAIASGKTLVEAAPEYRPAFRVLLEDIRAELSA